MIKLDRVKNEYIRRSLEMDDMAGKIRENRFRWFGYVKKKNNDKIVKKIGELRIGKSEERVGRKRNEWRLLVNEYDIK